MLPTDQAVLRSGLASSLRMAREALRRSFARWPPGLLQTGGLRGGLASPLRMAREALRRCFARWPPGLLQTGGLRGGLASPLRMARVTLGFAGWPARPLANGRGLLTLLPLESLP